METPLTNEQIDRIFSIKDDSGNSLTCISGNLNLQLATEHGRVRQIGRIEYKLYKNKNFPQLVYEKKEDPTQKYRNYGANGSWSVYYEIVTRVDGIVYHVQKFKYAIRREAAKQHGQFLHFKTAGIERKLYIPLEFWKVSSI